MAGGADKGLHIFRCVISLKMNTKARLEFELAYSNVIIQHASHFVTGPPAISHPVF